MLKLVYISNDEKYPLPQPNMIDLLSIGSLIPANAVLTFAIFVSYKNPQGEVVVFDQSGLDSNRKIYQTGFIGSSG